MGDLVDQPVRYDLAESIAPALHLKDLLTPDAVDRIKQRTTDYATTRGDADLRALIAASSDVDAEQVLVTAGSSAALFLLTFSRCQPGDHVVLITPCFPPTRAAFDAVGARVTAVPLSFDHGYRLDLTAVIAAITPDTRLVSLASPQNPSGVRFTDDELRQLLDHVDARAPEAVVLVDEAYRESVHHAGPVPRSAATLGPRVVTTSSLSKAHGAPGLRVGWLTATDPTLYEHLRRAKFNTFLTGAGLDELLAIDVLRHGERILTARAELLRTGLDLLRPWATAHSDAVQLVPPDGGGICCVRLRPDRFDDAAVRRFYAALADRDTRVAPGSWFGEHDRVFRVGFAYLPPAQFEAALDRLSDALAAV